MGTKKNDKKIKVSFCGENSWTVTGSCVLVESENRKILLECGLYQDSGSTLEQYKINNSKFQFRSRDIDYVFVMHAHSDHSMRVPLLFKRGFTGKVIAPKGTKDLFCLMGSDSATIMNRDAQELSEEYGRDYPPIYTMSDVNKAAQHYKEYEVGDIVELDEYIKFKFSPSGHIPLATQLEIWITDENPTKKIIYTSDLGNVKVNQYYTEEFCKLQKADIVISESTYGARDRVMSQKARADDIKKIESAVTQTCVDNNGRVVFGVFALARCQAILTMLYDIFHGKEDFNIPVLIDSPLAVKICNLYSNILTGEKKKKWDKVMSWKNLVLINDTLSGREWRDSNRPVVVLSSSGMMTHGSILRWIVGVLPREQDRIITCGYAAEGSLAAIIKEGKRKTIKISGKSIKNKCQVTQLLSMSSHMQRDDLLDYLSDIQCQRVFLVHGQANGKLELAEDLQAEISKKNNTSKVVCVNKGTVINI